MKQLCIILLLLILFASPATVRADAAPPDYPPGSNLQPGEEITQVRMAAETVVIEILKEDISQSEERRLRLGNAHVTADFTMHNLGTADESMAARFPISSNDGRGRYPEIQNLLVAIDGAPVSYRRANYPDLQDRDEIVPWAEFDVTFPVGKDVSIHVEYDLHGSGYYPCTAFYYILTTGAGWKDTIGSADIILRLPYEASPQNVIQDISVGWAETTPGGVFQGNEVRWHYEDFEPGGDQPVQNMEFVLVTPFAWQTILAARANVEKYPNDGETWGMFGKAYKEVFLIDRGYRSDDAGEELYRLSVEGYEKCLLLKPDDAQWHAGFAKLLMERGYWDSWVTDPMSHPTPEIFRALEEIHTALQLAPDDPVVQQLAWEISNAIPDGVIQNGKQYDFPWLTQTPVVPSLVPTDSPTTTPTTQGEVASTMSTSTPPGTSTPVHSTQTSATPAPQQGTPLCGSAALIPLVIGIWLIWRRS